MLLLRTAEKIKVAVSKDGYSFTPANRDVAVRACALNVKLFPSDGSSGVTLNATNPYFVDNAAATSGVLGQEGCTAYFHNGILELESMNLRGAGDAGGFSVYSALYSSSGNLIIELHGENSIVMTDRPESISTVSARAIYVRNGSLTLKGEGLLTVKTGDGYGEPSMAIGCASKGTCLTVGSGVSLTVSVGSSSGAGGNNCGIQAEQLINHGRIEATGDKAAIYLNRNPGSAVSENDGIIIATGLTGHGMILSADDTFRVNGGMVELKGALGMSAMGATDAYVVTGILEIDDSVKNGMLGSDSMNASVFSAAEILERYKSTEPVYSYMRLPGPSVTVSTETLDFGKFPIGNIPAAKTVTITNNDPISTGFDLPMHSDLTIVAVEGFTDNVALLTQGASATFSVQPKADLPIGSYSGEIRITFRNSTGVDIPFSFTSELRVYQITQGQDAEWTQGSFEGLTFAADADRNKLVSVLVDGLPVSSDDYTVESGSTVVKLKVSFLDTLSVEQHTLRMNFADGYAETDFTVKAGIILTLGDVNMDGEITAADASAILRYIVELEQLSSAQKRAADTNKNGIIDSADAADILRYIVKLIPALG